MVIADLFSGPKSVRVAGERRAFWTCIATTPFALGLVSIVLPSVSISEFILLIAAGLVFVSISRGRLLGSSIRIEGRQFPEIAELTQAMATRLGVAAPQVFVRDDPFVPIVSVGVGEPYALVISSQYYEHLRRDELGFLIAREIAHISAGHTRLTSLLSASGRENPLVAFVFGPWLRKTEFTADRVGYLCCENPGDALGAISITTFHAIGRRVDMDVLAEQRQELESDPALRIGEWIVGAPYATNRIEALRRFREDPLAISWRAELDAGSLAPAAASASRLAVARDECASVVRRVCAAAIDFAVISAVLQAPILVNATEDVGHHREASAAAHFIVNNMPMVKFGVHEILVFFVFFLYSALLVAIGGQTLGMTVMDVRVVTTDFAKPGILQSFWRYVIAFMSSITSVALVGFFMRIHLHDRFSRTRLVGARKAS